MARLPLTSFKARAPGVLQAIAILLLASGIGVWGALLFAPQAAEPALQLQAAPAASPDTGAISAWFGSGSANLNIKILGLIDSGEQSSVLLAIENQPPRAYRIGAELAPAAILKSISPHGIEILLDGRSQIVGAPNQNPAAAGINRVVRAANE